MATRVAINGFGRIGRLVARALLEKGDSGLELVAINDLADAESNALLFKRDSVHGAYRGEVRADGNDLIIDGRRVKVTAEKDPSRLPHFDNGIDIARMHRILTDRDGPAPISLQARRKSFRPRPRRRPRASTASITTATADRDRLQRRARPTSWRRS